MILLKKMYALFLSTAAKLFGLASAKRIDTFIRFRMKLDLSEPKTLAEKVTYIEFYRQSTLTSMCTDKFAVREYITKKGLADHLIPLVGGPWSSVEEIDFANLPESFVLKATHGCKMNYIVPIKRDLDEVKCRKEMQRWLRTTYGTYSLEPHYFDIPHRIYAEHFLGKQEDLVDYKFHCFNGKPHFIMASSDRRSDGDKRMQVTHHFFDMDWKPMNGIKQAGLERPGDGNLAKPNTFEHMIHISKKLSEDFEFVRVDLYEVNGRVYFGELTFTPFSSVFPMFTEKLQRELGAELKLQQ